MSGQPERPDRTTYQGASAGRDLGQQLRRLVTLYDRAARLRGTPMKAADRLEYMALSEHARVRFTLRGQEFFAALEEGITLGQIAAAMDEPPGKIASECLSYLRYQTFVWDENITGEHTGRRLGMDPDRVAELRALLGEYEAESPQQEGEPDATD